MPAVVLQSPNEYLTLEIARTLADGTFGDEFVELIDGEVDEDVA